MIKRAKRLALDLFKGIKDTYLSKSKDQQKNKEESANGQEAQATDNKKLRNSSSEKHISTKPKRSTFSRKKGRHAANSLPSPLNTDPAWRERSNSDPPIDETIPVKRKSKPRRAKSEMTISSSSSKERITREPLVRRTSILKKKYEKEYSPEITVDGIAPLQVPSSQEVKQETPVSFSALSTSADQLQFVAEKLEGPIARESEQMQGEQGAASKALPKDDSKFDWSDRRKATSILNLSAGAQDDSYIKHNLQIIAIWDTMMAKEIEDASVVLDAQKLELLEEIRLREDAGPNATQTQTQSAQDAVPRGRHGRSGSLVAFNDTVEIREVSKDGALRTSSGLLFDQPRPRPISRRMRKRMARKRSGLSTSTTSSSDLSSTDMSPLSSPINSPLSSPTISPACSPPVSPGPSPRASPLPFAPPQSSPTTSPTTSPITSPATSPTTSPNTSPTTRARNASNEHSKKPAMRAWAKVFAGKPIKTRSDEVNVHVTERAMEEEIAQVMAKYDIEKLELLEEIELREIREVNLRYESERKEILEEIMYRQTQRSPTRSPSRSPARARRHAMRLGGTLARNAAKGITATMTKEEEMKMAQDILESNAINNIEKLRLGAEVSGVKSRSTRSLRRGLVWRKNSTLRGAVAHNVTRKNLWIAEVPQALC